MKSAIKDLGKIMMTMEGEHNLEREYEILSVVSFGDISYISKKNVPSNIPVTNTEYWQFFGSLGITPKLRKNIETEYIEVSYDNGEHWGQLIALSEITGPQGIQGIQGLKGEPAVAIENYITVEATSETIDVADVLPSVGSADTVYRVSNWDGVQYNETTYSEYGWYDNAYKKLATRQIGIDDEPTANSQNLVKSGGVAAKISQLGQKINTIDINALMGDTNLYTLSSARACVPSQLRKVGIRIRYRKTYTSIEEAEFVVGDTSDTYWNNDNNWNIISDVIKYYSNVATSLANYKEDGYYNILPWTTLDDRPSGLSVSAVLIVFHHSSSDNGIQIVIGNDGNIWQRVIPWSGTPTAWNKVTELKLYRSNVTGSISNYKEDGYYNILSWTTLTDRPEGLTASAVLFVFHHSSTDNGIQVIISNDGNIWQRVIPWDGAAGAWNKLTGSKVAKTKWFALGDSITRGYYSDSGDGGITENNYPYYVSLINGWERTNYGTGGSGYVHKATVNDNTLLTALGLDKPNAKEIVDAVDFSNADIVTLAWGVNDWHYDNIQQGDIATSLVGDGTLVGNMRYVIEKILTDNPKAKIVVLLPMNTSMFGGNFSNDWGMNLDLYGNGTLKDFIDAEKSVCDFYGIQYIEQSKIGIVNRFNIESVLLDGLHPAIDVYLPLAKCLSKQIMFE